MEKLILKCGRYLPLSDADTAGRLTSMEAYLACLTQELEHLLAQLELALQDGAETEEA